MASTHGSSQTATNPIPPWTKETAYPTNIGDTDRHEPVVGSSFLFVLPPNWTFAAESTLTVEINHDRKVIERETIATT